MGTRTIDIPPDEWSAFFDTLSRQHQGRIISVEVLGADEEARLESHDVPLEGITVSLKGNDEVISIVVREETRTHILHTTMAPLHVRFEQTDEGLAKTLQIESMHGTATRVRFRPTMVPETVQTA
jgi:hypothetical protein